jgi:CRP-like cAMP-binding protein
MDDWSARVQASLLTERTDEDRAAAFMASITDELAQTTSRAEADAYARAGRFDFSWSGLARYWRKKAIS